MSRLYVVYLLAYLQKRLEEIGIKTLGQNSTTSDMHMCYSDSNRSR